MTIGSTMPPIPPALPTIVAIGALHVDEIARPFEPLEADASNPVNWQQLVGGVATNAARIAALHVATTLIAAVGDDANGQWLTNMLHDENIATALVTLANCSTGRYTAVLNSDGKLFVGLADVTLAESLDITAIQQRLPTTAPAAIMLDSNLTTDVIEAVVDCANQAATRERATQLVAINVSPFKAHRFVPVAARIDLMFCNRNEAARIAGKNTHSALPLLADALQNAGFKGFVITDGADKLLVQDTDNRTIIAIPPTPVTGNVNGAGDALAGATTADWVQGKSLAASVFDTGLPAARSVLQGNQINLSG